MLLLPSFSKKECSGLFRGESCDLIIQREGREMSAAFWADLEEKVDQLKSTPLAVDRVRTVPWVMWLAGSSERGMMGAFWGL